MRLAVPSRQSRLPCAHLEEVIDHATAQGRCDRGAVLKAGTGIDLNEPGLQAVIDNKIIPKELM